MTAYVIFMRESPVKDPTEMDTYRKKGNGSLTGFDMKALAVYGKLETVEGKAPDTNGIVILSFPTMEEARRWYNSPIYSAAAPHRQKAADYRAFIVEGV